MTVALQALGARLRAVRNPLDLARVVVATVGLDGLVAMGVGALAGLVAIAEPKLAPLVALAAPFGIALIVRSEWAGTFFMIVLMFANFRSPAALVPVLGVGIVFLELTCSKTRAYLSRGAVMIGVFLLLHIVHYKMRGMSVSDMMPFVKLAVAWFVVHATIRTEAAFKRMLLTLCVVGVTLSTWVVVFGPGVSAFANEGSSGLSASVPGGFVGRVVTPYMYSYNFFSPIMVFVMLVAIGLSLGTSSRRMHWVCGVIILLSLAMCLFARSRSTFVALVVVFGLIYIGRTGQRMKVPIVFFLILSIPFLPWNAIIGRALSTITGTIGGGHDFAWQMRLLGYRVAWQHFLDYPLLGVGMGTLAPKVPTLLSDGGGALTLLGFVHNVYLGIAATAGLLGFSMLMAVIIMTALDLRTAMRLFEERGAQDMVLVCWSLMLGFVSILIEMLAEPIFSAPVFWFIVIWAGILKKIARTPRNVVAAA